MQAFVAAPVVGRDIGCLEGRAAKDLGRQPSRQAMNRAGDGLVAQKVARRAGRDGRVGEQFGQETRAFRRNVGQSLREQEQRGDPAFSDSSLEGQQQIVAPFPMGLE
jgi:hypothetical protein